MKEYFVYMLTNRRNGTLYIGVTNNLVRRIYEHKFDQIEGFAKKYNLNKLVYFEKTSDIHSAISREKRLKKWNRAWKIKFIESLNPDWKDLSEDFILE
jgi:putative endonuclease